MNTLEAANLYCDECRARHLAERSVKSIRGYLSRFSFWCGIVHLDDLREATTQTILDYYSWLKLRKRPDSKPISVKYINRHIREVKAMLKLLADRHYIMTDITKNLPPLHDPKTLPRNILTKDQVMQLLKQPHTTTPLGFRDRAIFEVLYSTGLRGGELCKLSLYDYDPKERMIRVLCGKGKKDRVVPVGKVAASYLDEYIRTVRPVLLQSSPQSEISLRSETTAGQVGNHQSAISSVFLSATGQPLNTNNLHYLIRVYREMASLPESTTVHSLRHSCATEMLKGGASIRHVQELLGHADIQTTQIYTHVVPSDLKKAHARTSPSERRQTVDVPAFDDPAPAWIDHRNAIHWKKLKHIEETTKRARKRSGKG